MAPQPTLGRNTRGSKQNSQPRVNAGSDAIAQRDGCAASVARANAMHGSNGGHAHAEGSEHTQNQCDRPGCAWSSSNVVQPSLMDNVASSSRQLQSACNNLNMFACGERAGAHRMGTPLPCPPGTTMQPPPGCSGYMPCRDGTVPFCSDFYVAGQPPSDTARDTMPSSCPSMMGPPAGGMMMPPPMMGGPAMVLPPGVVCQPMHSMSMYDRVARADFARLSQERIESERLMTLRVREAQARAFYGLPPLF